MVIDKHSDGWAAIKGFVEESLKQMRIDNDNSGLDNYETAKLRGRIEYAKEILALEESPEKRPEVAENSYID